MERIGVQKKSPIWLRILEINVGLGIPVLCVVLYWPGLSFGLTLFAALAIALIFLEIAHITQIYTDTVSAERQLSLILSVLAILIAILIVATVSWLSYLQPPHAYEVGYILAVCLLAVGVLCAGIASAARGTEASKIIGILAVLIAFVVFVSPVVYVYLPNQNILVTLINWIQLLFPNFTIFEVPEVLLTLSLIYLALEPLISGVTGSPI